MAGSEKFGDNIGELKFGDFLAHYWEAGPAHFVSAVRAPEQIFDISGFEACLVAQARAGRSPPCVIKDQLARPMNTDQEKRDPMAAAAAAFAQSASILLPGLQTIAPALARMCRQLDNALLAHGVLLEKPVFANAYLTPPSAQGFGVHYDDHCVLGLQLAGSKRWVVAASDYPLPVERCTQLLPNESLATPLLEIELRAGDLLYVPRGFPHAAWCTDEMSLHVSFGINALTWSALLRRLADDVAFFRSSVRPFSSDNLSATDFLIKRGLPALMQHDPGERIEAMLGECLDALAPLVPETDDGFLMPALADATLLHRGRDVLTMPVLRGDHAILHFPGGPIELPAAAFEAIAYVAEHDRFRVGEIPEFKASVSRIELAELMIRRGIVSVVKDHQQDRPEHAGGVVHAN
ncbi:JmjC domain-containing protein [Rhizobium ruizarguesonis]